MGVGVDRGVGLAYVLGRVLPVQVEAEAHEHQTAQNLQHVLVGLDKVDDYRHAQPREQSVYQVGERRSQPRDKARPTALVQRALDTQYPYRPHRSRHQYAYGQSANNRVQR